MKGFKHIGFGIANNSDETIYSYNVFQSLRGTEFEELLDGYKAKDSAMSTLNIGGAIAPFAEKVSTLLHLPTLGTNLRFNQLTKKWDLQYGVAMNWTYFTVGASYKNSPGITGTSTLSDARVVDFIIPAISTTALTAGTKIGVLGLEYTLLKFGTPERSLQSYPFYSTPTKILTLLLDFKALHVSLVRRDTFNVVDQKVVAVLWGAQWQLLSRLSVAFQHNYIPGANSLSAQLLF